jgi:uncharacterized protein YecE (DUF72 family)
VETTPPGFVFAVKASRYLTHIRRLRDIADGAARLRERIAPLENRGKLGPILWQLPASFPRDDERLATALRELGPGRHAFEFRHPSWFSDDVVTLLRAHHVAVVRADSRRRPLPEPPHTAGWSYVRCHDGRGRRGRYSERQLHHLALSLSKTQGDVYVFFNNDWEGFAVENARLLRELAGDESTRRRRSVEARPGVPSRARDAEGERRYRSQAREAEHQAATIRELLRPEVLDRVGPLASAVHEAGQKAS